jgi:HK97 family phage major capsid protein
MATISEKITAAKAELVTLKDTLLENTKMLEADPDSDEALALVDELTQRVEKATKTLESLTRAESALAERAASAAPAAPAVIHSTGPSKDAEELWAKQATCAFIAHVQRKSVEQVMAERYPTNKALNAVVTKSIVGGATTFTPGWAQELVMSDTRGFINLLSNTSVAAAIANRSMMLSFDGYDTIKIPRRNAKTGGNNFRGAFVGEGGAIPLGRVSIGSETLARYKIGVIGKFTRELAERSTPSIEAVIRQAMLDDTSELLDGAFLDANAAVAGIRPAGLLNGVTVGAGTAGGGIDAVIADMKAMMNSIVAANLGTRLVLLVNTQDAFSVSLMQTLVGDFMFKDEIAAARLLGVEVVRSLNVPKGTAILLDAATVATAFDAASFDVSDVATIVEVNADGTAPTMAATAANSAIGAVKTAEQVPQNSGIWVGGSTGAAAGAAYPPVSSLFQTYSVAVRMVLPATWGKIQAGGVAAVDTLTW